MNSPRKPTARLHAIESNRGQQPATSTAPFPDVQSKALELLASGMRSSVVASTLGVHRVTLWKWQRQPEFREALEAIQEEALTVLREGLRAQAAKAVFVLGDLMDGPDPRMRRDAARIVLASYARLRPEAPQQSTEPEPHEDSEDVEERILGVWAFLKQKEADEPGFIASEPEFIKAKAWALEILARREKVNHIDLPGTDA